MGAALSPGDVCQCLQTVLVVMTRVGGRGWRCKIEKGYPRGKRFEVGEERLDETIQGEDKRVFILYFVNTAPCQDFPCSSVVKNPRASAGGMRLSPGLGRSHVPQSNQAHVPQLLSLRALQQQRSHRHEKPTHRD